jgi:VIT1/CCC1 family predicted Fe2+/Mn2+ transporter
MVVETYKAAVKALDTEVLVAAIYQHLAATYAEKGFRDSYSGIVAMERTHIAFWLNFLQKRREGAISTRPNGLWLFLYELLFGLLGKGLTLRIMEIAENQAVALYSALYDTGDLGAEEKRGLAKIIEDELIHEKTLANEETRYLGLVTYVKDAVLGLSDGLVEILAVTTGLAAASGQPSLVAMTGLVVAVAGGLSMGISTYASSRSQRQVHEGIIKRVGLAARFAGNIYGDRLIPRLEKRGYSRMLAEYVTRESAQNSRLLTNLLAEQEYGLGEDSLGNPLQAGLYAGSANILGAFIPLLPYFFSGDITTALVVSLLLATGALAATGFLVSMLAYLPPGRKIGEMLFSGLGSALVTYLIGRLAAIFFATAV